MVFQPHIFWALPAGPQPLANFNFCDFLPSDDHFERTTRQGIHLPSSNLSNKINQPNSSVANPASVVTNLDQTSCLKPQVSSLNRVFLSECFENPSESSELANSISDTNGLFFVPAFCGLQAPVNDPTAAAGLIGNLLPRHEFYVVLQNDCNSDSSYTPTSQMYKSMPVCSIGKRLHHTKTKRLTASLIPDEREIVLASLKKFIHIGNATGYFWEQWCHLPA